MLKKIVLTIVGLAIALVAGAYLLPREIAIQRIITIEADAAKIFPYINSLRRTNEWAIWLKRDPGALVTYSGPEAGVGARVRWASRVQDVGTGAQEIVESTQDTQVATKLDFGSQGTADARLTLTPSGAATQVVWDFHTDLGLNPVARYFGLMIENMIAGDYDQGLAELKRQVEAG
ncbi:MAG: SRPBCC family protein [Alphaproteobacteria bacterium]